MLAIENVMTTNLISGWVSQIGKWDSRAAGRPTYLGPQPETSRPYGICVSRSKLTEGTARATVVIKPQVSSEGPAARLIVGYISLDAQHYEVGIGGHGRKYTLVRYDPPGSWALLKGAGTASDLMLAHQYRLTVRIQGLKISLYDDDNLVFEHLLAEPLPDDSRLGLFAWGDCHIEYSDLSVDNIYPADADISMVLEDFDCGGVSEIWTKALARRSSDPEGAITSARTLLESVCKLILEKNKKPYSQTADLPALYSAAAEVLALAPSQQTEQILKRMLGSCQQVVQTLGELRNRAGDAHGIGAQPAKVSPRHAALAVNLAGAMALFLVETVAQREEGNL
jgi:hypothetical protein